MNLAPEGLLLADKPPGVTSHDVVDLARRALGQPRVGHSGTLDPFACGLLPLVLGRATRLVRFLPQSPKRYEGVLRLGLATSTDDLTGDVLRRGEPPPQSLVLEAAARFRGTLQQVPPAFSAKRVGGRRLHRLARQGRPALARPATIVVSRFELEPSPIDGQWRFIAEVSTGTYVRALARDLGEQLGCGGCLVSLRRVAIGPLRVDSAIAMENGAADRLQERLLAAVIPISEMPLELPSWVLPDAAAARRFTSGLPVPFPAGPYHGERYRVLRGGGGLVGIGELSGAGMRPIVVLPDGGDSLDPTESRSSVSRGGEAPAEGS